MQVSIFDDIRPNSFYQEFEENYEGYLIEENHKDDSLIEDETE